MPPLSRQSFVSSLWPHHLRTQKKSHVHTKLAGTNHTYTQSWLPNITSLFFSLFMIHYLLLLCGSSCGSSCGSCRGNAAIWGNTLATELREISCSQTHHVWQITSYGKLRPSLKASRQAVSVTFRLDMFNSSALQVKNHTCLNFITHFQFLCTIYAPLLASRCSHWPHG